MYYCNYLSTGLHMQPPKDWILLAVIGALLIVDLVFLIPVTAVENSRFFATTQKRQVSLN